MVLTIVPDEGYEVESVTLNGEEKGVVTDLRWLYTGDEVVVKFAKIVTEEDLLIAAIGETQLVARSKCTKAPSGKEAILITWYDKAGRDVAFEGVEIFRSTEKDGDYGDEPVFVSKTGKYYNTAIEKGTKYYYRVCGYVTINGEKVYTELSTRAIRTVR